MKKYELTREQIVVDGHTLHRIRALREIPQLGVKQGELGGYVEREENLSHEGSCWVRLEAKVYGNAWVYGDAVVGGIAKVYNNAQVFGHAQVLGNVQVFEDAKVFGSAKIVGDVIVNGDVWITD